MVFNKVCQGLLLLYRYVFKKITSVRRKPDLHGSRPVVCYCDQVSTRSQRGSQRLIEATLGSSLSGDACSETGALPLSSSLSSSLFSLLPLKAFVRKELQ